MGTVFDGDPACFAVNNEAFMEAKGCSSLEVIVLAIGFCTKP